MAKKKQKAKSSKPNQPPAERTRQLLVGALYNIFQKFGANPESQQGRVFVETLQRQHSNTAGTATITSVLGTIEHYTLFSSYRAPSSLNDQTTLRFLRRATYSEYRGLHEGTSKYIQSHCLEGLPLPPNPSIRPVRGKK
jgi:hypothetical protein